MMMMSDYQQTLEDYYLDPYHRGPHEDPTHAAATRCAENDCQLEFEVSLDGQGTILQAWFQGDGCSTCEGLASMLASSCEDQPAAVWASISFEAWTVQLGWPVAELLRLSPCATLPLRTLRAALASPLDTLDDDLTDGPNFGGPSLREEC